ncbi:hypothetical protein ABC766_02600 [Methylobacterium fujisawaense]|uniref:hypothetical protein n=1 Tax=Methylobacterium fujisawaense TaxID=107400 RepID=UPI0031F5A0B5
MNKQDDAAFDPDGGPIPLEQLKAIIGGNRPNEAKPMDGERASALTAGAESAAPVSGEAIGFSAQAPKITGSETTMGVEGRFEAKISYGPSQDGASGGLVGKVDVDVSGKKGDLDSVKVTVFDHGTNARLELTAAQVADRAASGSAMFKDVASKIDNLHGKTKDSGSFGVDIEKSFREGMKTKTAGPSGGYYSIGSEAKGSLLKANEEGQVTWKPEGETSSKGWQGKIEATQAKLAEHAQGDVNASRAAHEAATDSYGKAVEQHAAAPTKAAAQDAARGEVKASAEAAQMAVKTLADSARSVTAQKAEMNAADSAKVKAEANHTTAAAHSEKAQADADKALKSAAQATPTAHPKGFKTTDDVLSAKKEGTQPTVATSEAREALVKAVVASTTAKDAAAKTGKDLETASSRAENAAQKYAEAKQALKDNHASVDKAMADASAAKKALGAMDADGKPRERATSVTAQKTAEQLPADGKARSQSVSEKPGIADLAKIAADKSAALKTAEDKLAKVNKPEAARDKIQQDDRNALKNLAKDKGLEKVTDLGRDILLDVAKQDAKDRKQYHEDSRENVLAGGISQTVAVDGKTTNVDKTIAQVKTATNAIDFTSVYGSQHTREASIRAQAGTEHVKTTGLGGDAVHTEVKKAYAEGGAEAKAEVVRTGGTTSVEAAAKLVAHAEASYSETLKAGDIEAKQSISATAHGEVGAKAGASLGFDGVSVKASVSAEVSAKANLTHEVKIGDVKIKDDLEVFARAKAEAKADVKVNFNPFGKEGLGAKASVGAEAAAGVGVQKTVGVKSAGGGSAEVGGGVYAGKIGVKADVDLGYRDGKVSAGVNLGAALGIGISVNVKFESNVKLAMENAKRDIERGNVFEKFRGVLTCNPIGGFMRGIFS